MKRFRDIVLGAVIMCVAMTFAVPGLAASLNQTIQVTYRNIKLIVNGQTITPKDAVGNTVEPFVYNGTVYVPANAIGEATGYTVGWDNNTGILTMNGGGAVAAVPAAPAVTAGVNMIDTVGGPYDKQDSYVKAYPSDSTNSIVTMGGTNYTNSFCVRCPSVGSGYATFNLGGKYASLSGKYGIVDGTGTTSEPLTFTINIYGDGQLLKSLTVSSGALPTTFSVDVRGVSSIKFDVPTPKGGYGTHIGFADLILQ